MNEVARADLDRIAAQLGRAPRGVLVVAYRTPDGEPGLNYLCKAYKRFFHHVNPAMRGMASLVQNQRSPAEISDLLPEA